MNTLTVHRPSGAAPSTFQPGRGLLLQRKCACGGSAGASGECEACAKKKRLQARLAIGASNDPLEREADRVADQVLAQPAHGAIRSVAARIQRYSGQPSGETAAAPASVDHALAGSGRPLEPTLQQDMEGRFGHDFSRVQVHADATAGQSARDVNAHAYTVGHHIVFGASRYAPGTQQGRRLLAHELTHVLQQSEGGTGLLHRSPDEGEKPEEKPKFTGCSTDQGKTIMEAIPQAEGLAARAVQAFEREIPLSYESSAMRAHFGSLGSDQKATIIARYKHIQANVGGKPYTCTKKGKKGKEGNKIVDLCGQAPCPGSTITLFPDFGTAGCPAGPVLLHEAAHNAGACDDIDKDRSYPPADAEDNAYSYEYFAKDVAAGYKAPPELKKHKPKAP